jgi:phenylacetate-coenzyme A ligase PaaK-like adenylate-forming protein
VEGGAGAFEGIEGYMPENMEVTHIFLDENHKIHKTDLFLRIFPLIKFDIGDYIEPINQTPDTQLSHRLLGKVVGRMGEKIKLPSGEFIHPMLLNYFFDLFADKREIRKFRFVFNETKILLLLESMKSSEQISDSLRNELLSEMKVVFKNCQSEIEIVNALPLLANGKHRDWVYG